MDKINIGEAEIGLYDIYYFEDGDKKAKKGIGLAVKNKLDVTIEIGYKVIKNTTGGKIYECKLEWWERTTLPYPSLKEKELWVDRVDLTRSKEGKDNSIWKEWKTRLIRLDKPSPIHQV